MHDDSYLQKHLLEYFEKGKELHFSKDEIIVRPGEDPGGIYFLTEGYVTSYTITNYGETNLLLIHKSGEMFPLSAVLSELMPTSYHQAKTNITLRRVPRDSFMKSVRSDSVLSRAVARQLLNLFMVYENRIKELEFRSARERIMALFYQMRDRYGVTKNQDIMLDVPITHQDLADSLNMTRETASREIERLVREGVIERKNRFVFIKKIKVLGKLFD